MNTCSFGRSTLEPHVPHTVRLRKEGRREGEGRRGR